MHRCPLMAQSGHVATEFQCPLLGVKQTFLQLGARPRRDRFSFLPRSVGLRDGRNHPIKAHLHLARQVTKTGQSRPACIPERSLAAKLARFCIQYLPLGGRGYGDKRKCVNTSTSHVRAAARLCSLRGQHSTRNYRWRHSNVSRVALP